MFVRNNLTTEFDLFQLVSRVLLVKFHGFWPLKQEGNSMISVRHLVTSCELDYIIHGSEGAGFSLWRRATCQDENKESDVAAVTALLSIKWQLRIVAMLPNRLLAVSVVYPYNLYCQLMAVFLCFGCFQLPNLRSLHSDFNK